MLKQEMRLFDEQDNKQQEEPGLKKAKRNELQKLVAKTVAKKNREKIKE